MPWRLLLAGLVCSVPPDTDVIGFFYGIGYADALGHRGLAHSWLFAAGVGCAAFLAAPVLGARRVTALLVCNGAVLTHILLSAMTTGGSAWPCSGPGRKNGIPSLGRPIAISPFSLERLFSKRDVRVFSTELQWVWLPSAAVATLILLGHGIAAGTKQRARPSPHAHQRRIAERDHAAQHDAS